MASTNKERDHNTEMMAKTLSGIFKEIDPYYGRKGEYFEEYELIIADYDNMVRSLRRRALRLQQRINTDKGL